jgi:hypothetical protein
MIEIPDPGSITRVADWIELNVCTTRGLISKAALAAILERAGAKEPSEAFLSSVWRELAHRQRLYSQSFFDVQDRTVEPQGDTQPPPEYLACLILSLYGVQGRTQVPAKLFEKITCKAVERYLGYAIRFGWPFELGEEAGYQSQIEQKIRSAADELKERFTEAPPAHFKDRGVDIIGWVPFSEGRSSQLVILLQCAAGLDWKNKVPVPLEGWYQYIHWAHNPVKAFAVPGVITERDWHETSTDKGLLFDRARIVNLLSDGTDDEQLLEELNAWIQAKLAEVEED